MYGYIALGVLSVGATLIWRRLYPKPYPGIPYVESSAQRISGDVPHLMAAIKESDQVTDSMFAVSTSKLGLPVAQILFPNFRRPFIVVDDFFEVQDILIRRQKEFDKADSAADFFNPMFPHGTLSQFTTPALKAQKRLWSDAMRPEFLRKVAVPAVYKVAAELLELWRLRARINEKQPFDVVDDLKNATLDIIWASLLGKHLGTTTSALEMATAQLNDPSRGQQAPAQTFIMSEVAYIENVIAKNARTMAPVFNQKLETFTPRYRQFRRLVTTEIKKLTQDAMERYSAHRQSGSSEEDAPDTCIMDLVFRRRMVQAEKAGETLLDPIDDQKILDEILLMLVAGHDSTANTLAWFCKFMEKYPETQAHLRARLKESLPGVSQPSAEQILDTDIPYLDAVIEETFRLAGTAKGSVRKAMVDTQVLGYHVPKGAEVLLNFHIDHDLYPADDSKRNTSSEGARATYASFLGGASKAPGLHVFEPERWLTTEAETGKQVFNAYAVPSVAFGGGLRGCFGRKLATLEFRIIVVMLIMALEFNDLPDDQKSMKASEAIFRRPQQPFAVITEI